MQIAKQVDQKKLLERHYYSLLIQQDELQTNGPGTIIWDNDIDVLVTKKRGRPSKATKCLQMSAVSIITWNFICKLYIDL